MNLRFLQTIDVIQKLVIFRDRYFSADDILFDVHVDRFERFNDRLTLGGDVFSDDAFNIICCYF